MSKVNFLDKLQKDVVPGINLFELILFSVSTTLGVIFFLLTLFLWSANSNDIATNVITLIDIPMGVIAATFLAKRNKLAPLLLSIDALLYGSANIIAHNYSLGFVNFVLTPFLFLLAYFWLWKSNKNEGTNEVITRKLNLKTGILISALIIMVAVFFGIIMAGLGKHTEIDKGMPVWLFWFQIWFDSFSAALMLAAVIASVTRFREVWYFYFTADILKIILFGSLIINGYLANIELLILSLTYFTNSLFGMFIWKDSKVFNLNKNTDNEVNELDS